MSTQPRTTGGRFAEMTTAPVDLDLDLDTDDLDEDVCDHYYLDDDGLCDECGEYPA